MAETIGDEQQSRGPCLQCLRLHCMCAEYPGMTISDDDLLDVATSCSSKALRLKAEIVLRQRYPARSKANGAR